MSTVHSPPPWKSIQWFSIPRRLQPVDVSGSPIQGTWIEERNEEIEQLKESIQPFDKTELWDLAKRITNPYELINTHSSRLKLPQSICCIYPLSRSFFKMVEILTQLDFFERHKVPKLRSMHVCEGPGGFIEAFHSMASDKNRIVHVSYAMTLKSTHTMIPGWRRATTFLQKHTNIELLYGPTRTGNIYEPKNQEECRKFAGTTGVHLATADGGFDFSEDFYAQEKSILRLIVCSAIILLQTIAIEGDIVLKLFDCNSPATRDLVALLASCFQQWTLYKPVTSRPCNSEWYFLGKSAVRNRAHIVKLLQTVAEGLSQDPPVQYERILQENPLEDHIKSLQVQRCQKQMQALKEVLKFCHEKDGIDQDSLWQKQRAGCIEWCHAFRMATQAKV